MTDTASRSAPTTAVRRSRLTARPLWLAVAAALIVAGAVLGWSVLMGSPSSSDSRALQRAEDYGRSEIVWSQGPSVQSRRVVPLGELDGVLAATVPVQTRQDINVAPLQRRYGAGRRVAMVVLRGTYNTLPPDEGINVHGDVVVLVDVKTNRVILGMG